MITLITGTPGAGKTLFTVSQLLKDIKDRTLVVDGIPELLLDHEVSGDITKWNEWCPDSRVLVIDEAQRYFRPRSAASTVPSFVAALETHRHRNIDLILVTQHPLLLDANVRRLVGKHVHVRRAFGFNRALTYTWDFCSADLRLKTAVMRSFSYKESDYKLYKSAVAHSKPKFRLPAPIYVLGIALVASVAMAAYFLTGHKPINQDTISKNPVTNNQAVAAAGGSGQSEQTKTASLQDYVQRISFDPSTAPLFDHVRKVQTFPRVASCVQSANACTCYTQQATRLENIPADYCQRFAQGKIFDPYDEPEIKMSAAGDARSAASKDDKTKTQTSESIQPFGENTVPIPADPLSVDRS
ncbi:MAG: zonular occludens toxin domain-containing protein [Thiobacillaceae bacterium]